MPTRPLTQGLAVLAGFAGIIVAALLAGLAVRAMQRSAEPKRKD